MACKIIYNGQKYTDDEFKKYLEDNHLTEPDLIHEKAMIDTVSTYAPTFKGIYKDAFAMNPRGALNEIAQQANSSASEKRGMIKAVGRDVVDIAQKMFPNAKSGDAYLQTGREPKPASPATISKIKEFNDRIGVKTQQLEAIVVNGKRLNASGLAAPYEGLIQIVNGKEDVALPEESMHIAVEIIQQKSPALFKRLMNNVNKHPELQEVFDDYSDNKLYQLPDGKPDVIKLKKEAAAKVLARVVGQIVDNTETGLVTMETVKMWNDMKDWFKNLFGSAGYDPFKRTAEKIVGGEDIGSVHDISKQPFYSNISTTAAYRTMDVGNHEGEQEFVLDNGVLNKAPEFQTPMKMEQIDAIRKWDSPVDDKTNNPRGETMGQFVGRTITRYIQDKATASDHTAIMTHSSVLKTIKTYEKLKDLPEFKGADWNHLNKEQAAKFADEYIKASTQNGDIETYPSANGSIHIARHGETEDNRLGVFRTPETELTDKGIEQAIDVGNQLRAIVGEGVLLPAMISSHLNRTIHSANLAMNIINDGRDLYLQLDEATTFKKIDDTSRTISKEGSEYKVNGVPIKNSVDKIVERAIEKKFPSHNEFQQELAQFRKEYTGRIEQEISTIAKKYIGDDGLLRKEVSDDPLPSVIDPYDRTFINSLDKWFADKVDSYPAGTKFLTNKDLYNPKADFAGRANFIALVPTAEGNKVDINQFKLITPRKGSTGVDYRIKPIYDLEIQGLRDILSKAYAIPASEFRETRAIPIKAGYYPNDKGEIELQNLKIGNVDVNLEKDPLLLPIPSFSELTGNAALDELITRFRATADLEAKTPAAKGQEKAKANRVAEAFAALTELQIRKNAAGILKSGNMAVSLQESKFPVLKKKIEDTDPLVAQVKGIGDLFNELDQAKRKLSPYVDLGRLMSEIYGDSAEETKTAEALSDKAVKETTKIENTMKYLRTQKLSKITGIKDELKAERNTDTLRKYGLGPSHASTKSGGQLYHLIEQKTNLMYLKNLKKMEELDDICEAINKSGTKWDDVEKKILDYDDKGRWTGKTIQQLDKSFYDTINASIKSKNLAKVRESIDLDAYKTAYDEGLEDIKEYYSYDGNIGDNPPEGSIEKARAMRIENWKMSHDISKKTSINPANSLLFRFPKEEMWDSEKYKELLKPSNKPVLDLFNWQRDLVNKADELGMFHEMAASKYGFFANIEKGIVEKITKGGINTGVLDLFKGMTTTPGGEKYGEFDPVTYKPINTVRGRFLRDLSIEAHDTDGNYFKDFSNVSHDLPRTLILFAADVADYELKVDTEGTAKLILATEAMIPSLKGTRTKTGQRGLQKIPNVANLDTIAQYMEMLWYDKPMADQADITHDFDLSWVKRMNKFLGFKLIPEPKNDIVTFSALGILNTFKGYYWMKTMVFNAVGAFAWAAGGSMGAILNAGEYFNRMDFLRAYGQITGSIGAEKGKIRAGIIDYFQPTLFSTLGDKARKMSSNPAVTALNPSKFYVLMSEADKFIANNVAIAYINNTIVRDGKLLNIRKLVKEQNNWDNRFSLEPPDRQALERKVEAEIKDMQENSPELLMKVAQVNSKGRLVLKLANEEEEYVKYRAPLRRLLAEALGNMGADDPPLYRRFTIPNTAMTFKSWMPEILYKIYGPMEWNPGAHDYTLGRGRAMVGWASSYGIGAVSETIKLLTGNKESLIDWAKRQFEKDRQKAADKGEDFDIPMGKYVDLKTEGVVSGLKNIGMVLALLGMYFGAVAAAKNFKDQDHTTKGWISFTLRTIDRLQDEVSFFYNPKAFAALATGAIFPPLSLLLDMGTLFKNTLSYTVDKATGNDAAAAKIHNMKILYRDLPVLKEWAKYETILSAQFAKDNGYTLPLGEASTQQ